LITKDVSEKLQGAENRVTAIETKIKDDSGYKQLDERIKKLEAQLDQFTKVYELITSQYSPFIGDGPKAPIKTKVEEKPELTLDEKSKSETAVSSEKKDTKSESQVSPVQVFIQTGQSDHKVTTKTGESTLQSIGADNSQLAQTDTSSSASKSQTPPKPPLKNTPASFAIDAPIEHAFVTFSNHSITSIPKLGEVLSLIDDDEFSEFVTGNRNDFATWVRDVIQDADFAQKLSGCKDRISMQKLITAMQ
jgi:hypothetical protein